MKQTDSFMTSVTAVEADCPCVLQVPTFPSKPTSLCSFYVLNKQILKT